mmetsp:Transcript_13123/g.15875  ORF Transcript_13123/g.15875 Transcript_13123/m.15875 type:complete len:421 (+) Transcript_13123:93-1355(+)|eukprot:CAMPEP_0197859526 /NCGR_PEP_ID=MMETSP1438-20131217/34156_1 /TAXON_ID=1461541 /ORGANISM="Pterosperma sp., Strain CCMP1384" /LENGTH=420 /DNA_ID=CAMNT_0043476049 /DNA_START=91 /DNA_END=1353 /DNA_ORIENTATION=+
MVRSPVTDNRPTKVAKTSSKSVAGGDLYSYASICHSCVPVSTKICEEGNKIEVQWEDKHTSLFHATWLRVNCPCPECLDASQQRIFLPCDLDLNTRVVKLETTNDNKSVHIETSDGHKIVHPANWLRTHCYSDSSVKAKVEKRLQLSDMPIKQPPKIDATKILTTEEGKNQWMATLVKYGIALVTDLNTEAGQVKVLAERIANVQPTVYGDTWHVISKPNAENIAYTSANLVGHMDLLAYEAPPAIQFLHCRKFDEEIDGGANSFIDAFAAARRIRENTPEHFKVLCNTYATFHKLNADKHMMQRRPHIVLDDRDEIVGVNWSPPFEGPLQVSPDEIAPYFAAYKAFSDELNNKEHTLKFRLKQGECVTFMNRRLLHARDGFDLKEGLNRHLEGTYILGDDFYNAYRLSLRDMSDVETIL